MPLPDFSRYSAKQLDEVEGMLVLALERRNVAEFLEGGSLAVMEWICRACMDKGVKGSRPIGAVKGAAIRFAKRAAPAIHSLFEEWGPETALARRQVVGLMVDEVRRWRLPNTPGEFQFVLESFQYPHQVLNAMFPDYRETGMLALLGPDWGRNADALD